MVLKDDVSRRHPWPALARIARQSPASLPVSKAANPLAERSTAREDVGNGKLCKQWLDAGVKMELDGIAVTAETREPLVALIARRIEVTAPIPQEVIDGHVLRRAADQEIKQFKAPAGPLGPDEMYFAIHEQTPTRLENGGTRLEALLPGQWRYYVVEVRDWAKYGAMNGGLHAIEDASSLLDVELQFSLGIGGPFGGRRSNLDVCKVDPFSPALTADPARLDDTYLHCLRETESKLRSVRAQYDEVDRAMGILRDIGRIEQRSVLQVLGKFAIIELLLTHNPEDRYDSLTHQIKTKIPLVNRRLSTKLNYRCFEEADEATIWGKLYSLRSCIAHGGKVQFTKNLSVLKDLATVNAFLRSALKALLRFTLDEPQLVRDLREC